MQIQQLWTMIYELNKTNIEIKYIIFFYNGKWKSVQHNH